MKRTSGYRRRADVNHVEILDAFRRLGCTVTDLRLVGRGCPDALIGYRGIDHQVEVKKPRGPKAKADDRKPTQVTYAATWKGQPPAIVRTVEDVEQLVNQWNVPQGVQAS